LKVTLDKITKEDFSAYSMGELKNEKSNVKNELKKYDTAFI
jgi:hypothetical protein